MPKRSQRHGLNTLDALGLTPRGRDYRRQIAEREAAAATKPSAPAAPPRPALPPLGCLTVDDRQRITAALGVEMPTPIGGYGVQPDAALSKQLADRYVEDLARYRDHDRQQRTAALEQTIGTFDGRNATPEDCHARLRALGIEDSPVGIAFHPAGRALDRRPDQLAGDALQVQSELDLRVAERVKRAMARGERVDARRLTPGEMRALMSLRDVGA